MDRQGKIHLYAGDGKGKTTAALGLCLRAAASGMKVLFVQFLKDGSSSELQTLRSLDGVEVISGQSVKGFTFQMNEEEKIACHAELEARLETVCQRAVHEAIDLLILDEALGAIQTQMIDEAYLIDFMKHKPEQLELVLTGRNPSEAIIELSDYYSEVCLRKHPYVSEGLGARRGIEY